MASLAEIDKMIVSKGIPVRCNPRQRNRTPRFSAADCSTYAHARTDAVRHPCSPGRPASPPQGFEDCNNKPALLRAYRKTTKMDGNGDAFVQPREFPMLLQNIYYFNKVPAAPPPHRGHSRAPPS